MATRKKAPAKAAATPAPNTSAAADSSPDQVDVSDQATMGTPVVAADPVVTDAGALETQDAPPEGEYTVLSPLEHDGRRYGIGTTVTLSQVAHDALPGGVVEAA